MKTYEKIITIEKLTRLNNSYCGNPAWRVGFTTDNGDYLSGRTATNSMAGYCLSWYDNGKKFKCTYHYTKADNLIINRLEEIKGE